MKGRRYRGEADPILYFQFACKRFDGSDGEGRGINKIKIQDGS